MLHTIVCGVGEIQGPTEPRHEEQHEQTRKQSCNYETYCQWAYNRPTNQVEPLPIFFIPILMLLALILKFSVRVTVAVA